LVRRYWIYAAVAAVVVIAVIVLIAAGGGDDHSVEQGNVAEVNGEPISQEEFDHWLGVVAAVQRPPKSNQKPQVPKKGSPEYEQLAQQVMQFLVSGLWIDGEAADRDITATDQEVKKQFEQTKDQSFPTESAYKKFLRQSGQSEKDILFRVRLDVLSNKIRQQVTRDTTNVDDSAIGDYYKQNEAQFSQPERRDLRMVLTDKEDKAKEAVSRIQSGESFSKVAKDLSKDPATKNQGGRLLGITKGQQETDFDKALFEVPRAKLTGPVKTPQGFYVFEVTKITPATKQSLEQSKEGIRQLLISQKQQQELDKFTTGFRDRWRGRTDCLEDLAIPDCANGEEPPPPGLGTGPAALSGAGTPPALTGAQPQTGIGGIAPGAQPGGIPGSQPGAAPAATGPAALGGGGTPPALSAAPAGAPAGVPGGAVPPGQGGAPQGGAPQGGAPAQGGAAPPGG
jgi:foldase protein PrsA